ncbi:MAG: preprotein translocase subunit SecG [Candidatus Liptonbacteria bacterium]|nr:preprotein translocase subunit SecG [Candidatus Liptonbacteria bacterium]
MISILHIIVSVLLIALILIQERSAGLSSLFGGEGFGFYQTRRGLEKIAFWSTVGLIVLFVLLSIVQLY